MPLLMLFVFVATEIWLLVELVNRFGAGPIFGWIFSPVCWVCGPSNTPV